MSGLNDDRIRSIVRLFPSFADIPRKEWAAAQLVSVTPDKPHSIREGHLFQHAMFIVSGWIRVYQIGPTGKEMTLYRVQGGQCCALMMASLLGDIEYEASIAIEAETEVLLVPVPEFKRWMAEFKPFNQYVYKEMIQRITKLTGLLDDIAFQPIPYRLADYLIRASAKSSEIRITHERLAVEIGTSREVVTRALKEFAGGGAVELERGLIRILDRAALKSVVDRIDRPARVT